MRSIIIILLLAVFSSVSWPALAVSENKAAHLFFIERSKNKNLVQYDVRLTENRDLPDASPVRAYWVLENGGHEELDSIERRYAYGIATQEKLDKNKFRVILVSLKGLEILVEKINDSFKAVVSINGKQSILERVYIESKERLAGLPKVLYIDLFGWDKEKGFPTRERIIPK